MAGGDRLVLIGVRHHSPACARHVRRIIEEVRPAFVLIEGPSDFNPYLGDLRLEHKLPIAIFSFYASATESRASYAPFCDYSPEWQALIGAWRVGATPLFCDLPAWHAEFGNRTNRYADPHDLLLHSQGALAALAREFGAEGHDALWDVIAEQGDTATLPQVLERYFNLLRPEGTIDPRESARETCMAAYAAWALRAAAGRQVVLVCGGWHVAGVRDALRAADGAQPAIPVPPCGTTVGSYLVPYSYVRLDRFTGYAAGMPSPGYYHALDTGGHESAADWSFQRITAALRRAGQVISTADVIAWRGHALALAHIRGHRALLRTDILDAALTTLMKDAVECEPAWTRQGPVSPLNDPLILAMLRSLSGEREGTVAREARRPPLIGDVEARLQAADLVPGRPARKISIAWRDPAARARAHTLHQLRLLALPGITQVEGTAQADARDLTQTFEIVAHLDWTGALIEASMWGGTLPTAAAARLSSGLADRSKDLDHLATALSDALFAGLFDIGQDLVAQIAAGIGLIGDIAALGRIAQLIARLYRFGDVFETPVHRSLGTLAETAFARILWLVPLVRSSEERATQAVLACRDLARHGDGLNLDLQAAFELFARCAVDEATPPELAGASLGYLLSCGREGAVSGDLIAEIRRFGLPQQLGDFLAGLFALAREELSSAPEALAAIDALVVSWGDDAFLRALPAMRLAFGWFPPREREALARAILRRHGATALRAEAEALGWMRQQTPLTNQAAVLALEARTAQRLARHGLA